MSAALYPEAVWRRFAAPRFVLSDSQEADAEVLAQVSTPASAERAVLYGLDGVSYWRAHATPWLAAALEVVCEHVSHSESAELESALDGLQIPPARRYCAVMARELWRQSQAVKDQES